MSNTPQFGTAEYVEQAGVEQCKTCGQPIVGQYYKVNGATACSSCAQKTESLIPEDNNPAFIRGIVFGICGAIAGLILYSGFGIITGWTIGYLSLAVGYIVSRSIMFGSGGLGGRRYQIAAVVLTYAAVSMSAVPIFISQSMKEKPAQTASSTSPATDAQGSTQASTLNPISALAILALLGLASPFLELAEPASGVLGLIILFVGINIAWKMTAGSKISVMGPYNA